MVQASTFAGSAGQAMSMGAGVVGKQVMTSAGSASRKVGAIIRQVCFHNYAVSVSLVESSLRQFENPVSGQQAAFRKIFYTLSITISCQLRNNLAQMQPAS